MADRVGQQLGEYRLIRLLGKGGFAEVYLGEHMYLGSLAAIKVLRARLAQDEMDEFLTEARTIARLNHPHIVRVLDFGVDAGTPYLVMQYAPGGTLRSRYPRGSMLPVETVLPYARQVADALHYAHEQKLIHRDVKPENILLGEQGSVLLSDFGIATIAHSSRSQSQQEVAGTVNYIAPEQLQGYPRPASDQYALGVVVYEWLTGERPFQGNFSEVASQHLLASPPPLRERIPALSPLVEQVVLTALAKDPKRRFARAQAFATALEQAARGQIPQFPAEAPAAPLTFEAPLPMQTTTPSGPTTTPPGAFIPVAERKRLSGSSRLLRRGLAALLVLTVVLAGLGTYLALRARIYASPAAHASTTTQAGPSKLDMHEVSLLPGDFVPEGIALLKDGTVFFSEAPPDPASTAPGAIGRITPDGKVTPVYQFKDGGQPREIVVGPDGNLWCYVANLGYIARIAPDGTPLGAFLVNVGVEYGFVVGPDGNLWFTGNDNLPLVGRFTPQGSVTLFRPPEGMFLEGLTLGPNPALPETQVLWFTTQHASIVGYMNFDGSTDAANVYPLPSDTAFPEAITYDSTDGNLWLILASNQLGRILPSRQPSFATFPLPPTWVDTSLDGGGGASIFSIVADSQGNLWFTNPAGNQIGRATTQGQVTLFDAPNGRDLVAAADGSLWFMEDGANKLAHITFP